MTIQSIRATEFLDAAERFVSERSPWDCMHCARLAFQLDPSLAERARKLLRQAAELPLASPIPVSDDLDRLRRFVSKLEAAQTEDLLVRGSAPKAPADSNAPPRQSGDPIAEDVRQEMARVYSLLEGKEGRRFERARAVLRALLARFPASDTGEKGEVDKGGFGNWCISAEHEYHNLGNSLYKAERWEEAIEMYNLALSLRPDLLETYFNRGLAYTRLGRYECAEEDLTKAVELNPCLSECWYTRGLVREYKLEYDEAISDYDKALEVDPQYHKAEQQRTIARNKRDALQRGSQPRKPSDDYEGVVKDYASFRVKPDCRLSQVGDHASVKHEFRKILSYLRGGLVLDEWGGEQAGGVLMYGDSGVGKTHLARALAGEAEVPFYAPPISMLFDMYVGNSEKSLRNLFAVAAADGRAIVFLDEIDVLASRRHESRQAHEPWHARFSACLLEEMDNIANRNRGVVVIGATNCLGAIDPAFLRPGRFTYVIEVKRPGEVGMAEIFLACLETASHRAKRLDFLAPALARAILAPRKTWLERAFRHDDTGLVDVAQLAVQKEMVGDDVRETIRRVVDERIYAGLDGVDLGPITVQDLRRHVQDYVMVRNRQDSDR